MKNTRSLPLLVAALFFCAAPGSSAQETKGASVKASVPDDFGATIETAVEILVSMQESLDDTEVQGEWPYEGVYREKGNIPIGYRVGGTAIGAWALIETPQYARDEAVRASVGRGLDFVLRGLAEEKMAPGFSRGYDVRGWGHTYALNLLLRMRTLKVVPETHEDAVNEGIVWLIDTLQETEIPEVGGWNYSRRKGYENPGPASPFMTAPTLLALFEARAQGEKVDDAVVARALDSLEAARTEAGTIPYTTGGGRADPAGATGRTPITEVVLYLAGRSDQTRIAKSLDDFFEHWEWLEKRRQQTGTHVAPYGIAPYYFYYAHTYAALAIQLLPDSERAGYRARFLERLFQTQEESGGWNDRVFPRSENYGTAMSLLAVLQPELPLPSEWKATAKSPEKGK